MNSIYDTLNPMQREAVLTTEGPVLVLAGAGSGKTRALTHRIAYLTGEKGVQPWHILAITFTNKAANEMRERVDALVPGDAGSVWVATFHSTCVRILRRDAELLGYTNRFTIYDSDDQKTLMRQVIRKLDRDPKLYKDRAVLSQISAAKNELVSVDEFYRQAAGDFRKTQIAEIYEEYQKQLRANNAMDFDDLLFRTVELLRQEPEVLEYYQNRFRYIMVDEYQDTNTAQFEMVRLLACEHRNLCVVGDDDQSIYKFRGANIRNILDFEQAFPGAKVIRLEQNYRSTKNILDVANAVIKRNEGRKEKSLWTENEVGKKVSFWRCDTASREAEAIVEDIRAHRDTYAYGDCAVLYRTNAQSRILEEKCVAASLPYRLVGGVNFYQRKEIKDLICYLKTVADGRDDLAVQRIINVPRRGIGQMSIGKINDYAVNSGLSFYEALTEADRIPGMGRTAVKIRNFVRQIESLRTRSAEMTVKDLLEAVLEETGYQAELEAEETIEAKTRLENIGELVNKAADLNDAPEDAEALDHFLEEIALVAEVDQIGADEDRVVLMTLHSAKGLEFPRVYLSGMEDGLFPGQMAIFSADPTDVEEERRLCYVGITRAQKELTLSAAKQRMVNGETTVRKVSRFVDEIPRELLDYREFGYGASMRQASAASGASEARGGKYRPKPTVLNSSTTAAYLGKQFKVEKADSLSYGVGDRVRHAKFGEGTVEAIENGKRDYEVTVHFDRVGIKKLFASFAKLEKI